VALLSVEHAHRTYRSGAATIRAVTDVSLSLDVGDFVALVGPSGCGKSTLLHLCGAMDRPTSGAISLDGTNLGTLGDDALTRVRRERVGFVFQFFNLLPTLTVAENVELPLLLAGTSASKATSAACVLLDRVGLGPRLRHYPAQLSGGEMQRTAVARALVHRPSLLVADEPTGNLDSDNGRAVLELLVELNREMNVTLLLATHAADVGAAAGRVVHMRDGSIGAARSAGPARASL
jgi:putative ABC transport system ATP-binding protein